MVVVLVAAVQEGRDAVLQRHQRRADREQLVPGHEPAHTTHSGYRAARGTEGPLVVASSPVVVVRVQVAPLPDGCVGPAAREVGLGLALHLQVVRRELAPLGHVAHYVEQPVPHATREVQHLVFVTLGHLAAHAVVLDLHVVVLRPAAQLGPVQAQAALLVHLAIRRPRLVVVGAHLQHQHTSHTQAVNRMIS